MGRLMTEGRDRSKGRAPTGPSLGGDRGSWGIELEDYPRTEVPALLEGGASELALDVEEMGEWDQLQ